MREPGEFALRGGIVDLWPPGTNEPLRLDFFGDELETIRRFDADVAADHRRRSTGSRCCRRARRRSTPPRSAGSAAASRELFGAINDDDPLYEAVSAGRKQPGMEHWLPLFHDQLDTLFDYLPRRLVLLGHQTEEARDARLELIARLLRDPRRSCRQARQAGHRAPPYKPLKPDALYLDRGGMGGRARQAGRAPAFALRRRRKPRQPRCRRPPGRDFAPERPGAIRTSIFQAAARHHIGELQAAGKRVLIACWTEGSRDRMGGVLSDHGVDADPQRRRDWPEAQKLHPAALGIAVLRLEHGFAAAGLRHRHRAGHPGRPHGARRRAARARPQNFLAEASALAPGDLVTHIEHGVGRYLGLKTIDVAGAPHDCLELL